jgi:hypothetical protein
MQYFIRKSKDFKYLIVNEFSDSYWDSTDKISKILKTEKL